MEVKIPVTYDRKSGYIIDAEGFNIAHCYVYEWALELVELINDTDNARHEAMKMANAIDLLHNYSEAVRVAVLDCYGTHHGPFITKHRNKERAVVGER